MSEDEKMMYGDRMVENYEKVDLLGKYEIDENLIKIWYKGVDSLLSGWHLIN